MIIYYIDDGHAKTMVVIMNIHVSIASRVAMPTDSGLIHAPLRRRVQLIVGSRLLATCVRAAYTTQDSTRQHNRQQREQTAVSSQQGDNDNEKTQIIFG
jgi:hypothetical protein